MTRRFFGPEPRYEKVSKLEPKIYDDMIVIGGPCSAETEDQLDIIFSQIRNYINFFRCGVFRAGTYPGSNFGWEMDLLKYANKISNDHGIRNIVDILDFRDMETIDPYVGAYQVNMRQAQNYSLLRELGKQKKTVFLKRGTWMTYDETMGALEYILNGGNEDVYLIERGSVSYLDHSRWEPSISMIAKIKRETNIDVIIDGSHSSGERFMVDPITMAGIAAGANGVLIETHHNPDQSLSDSEQALSIDSFIHLVQKAHVLHEYMREADKVTNDIYKDMRK